MVKLVCIQGKLFCIKPSLQIFQLILYSFAEILNCARVIIYICSISKKIKFQMPRKILQVIDK